MSNQSWLKNLILLVRLKQFVLILLWTAPIYSSCYFLLKQLLFSQINQENMMHSGFGIMKILNQRNTKLQAISFLSASNRCDRWRRSNQEDFKDDFEEVRFDGAIRNIWNLLEV